MKKTPFFKLESLPKIKVEDGFSLDTRVLELEMMKYNGGIDLENSDYKSEFADDYYRKFVPYLHSMRAPIHSSEIKKLAEQNSNYKDPCAMLLKSEEELLDHMSVAYQIAHSHYILAKRNNLDGSFPRWCCGVSGINSMLNHLSIGHVNASYAYSHLYDHGFMVLPFILAKKDISGTIFVDPTSDQTWFENSPRNSVLLKLGSNWKYKTDWCRGADLFPTRVCSIDILKEVTNDITGLRRYHQCGQEYFEAAFANPVYVGRPTFRE